jgi:hypothetical protein
MDKTTNKLLQIVLVMVIVIVICMCMGTILPS